MTTSNRLLAEIASSLNAGKDVNVTTRVEGPGGIRASAREKKPPPKLIEEYQEEPKKKRPAPKAKPAGPKTNKAGKSKAGIAAATAAAKRATKRSREEFEGGTPAGEGQDDDDDSSLTEFDSEELSEPDLEEDSSAPAPHPPAKKSKAEKKAAIAKKPAAGGSKKQDKKAPAPKKSSKAGDKKVASKPSIQKLQPIVIEKGGKKRASLDKTKTGLVDEVPEVTTATGKKGKANERAGSVISLPDIDFSRLNKKLKPKRGKGEVQYNSDPSEYIPNITLAPKTKYSFTFEVETGDDGRVETCTCPAYKAATVMKTCKHLFMVNGPKFEQKRLNGELSDKDAGLSTTGDKDTRETSEDLSEEGEDDVPSKNLPSKPAQKAPRKGTATKAAEPEPDKGKGKGKEKAKETLKPPAKEKAPSSRIPRKSGVGEIKAPATKTTKTTTTKAQQKGKQSTPQEEARPLAFSTPESQIPSPSKLLFESSLPPSSTTGETGTSTTANTSAKRIGLLEDQTLPTIDIEEENELQLIDAESLQRDEAAKKREEEIKEVARLLDSSSEPLIDADDVEGNTDSERVAGTAKKRKAQEIETVEAESDPVKDLQTDDEDHEEEKSSKPRPAKKARFASPTKEKESGKTVATTVAGGAVSTAVTAAPAAAAGTGKATRKRK